MSNSTSPTPQYADLEAQARNHAKEWRGYCEQTVEEFSAEGGPCLTCRSADLLCAMADALRDLQQALVLSFGREAGLQQRCEDVLKLCDEASPATVEVETMEQRGGRVVTVLNICNFKAVSEAKIRTILAPPRSDAEQEKPA